MLIRTEAPADLLAIDRLLKNTFPTEAEANLVMKLRENGHLTLSLVACTDEGEVIAHVMFSPVTLDGQDYNWQGLAPLVVKEEYRNQGIGSDLVKEGFESLAMFGYPACVVLGDPNYYGRLGFVAAEQHQMRCQWEVPEGAFQVKALVDGEFSEREGTIEYCAEFLEL
ncbi:N-acetyltransferase [Vibrio sinensis]|uniref:N-acetyltransferase n=1 Tax=Vibrio sinensis TaxID=2302434 RepID=A0A3A6QPA6_9VIBR|nr:N-acetyltransferase [Vibrio sinensis]RJX70461.1 N-acetyltransferase [Vibrio sinensis]